MREDTPRVCGSGAVVFLPLSDANRPQYRSRLLGSPLCATWLGMSGHRRPQSHHPATAFNASRPNSFIHPPVHVNMPIARPSSFTTSFHVRLFMLTLKWGYRLTIRREGSWFESLIQETAPHSGERILERSRTS